ncbi:MAG: hypothetical protein LIO92_08620 [Clostridiales bacterium]|nr:hypothetical protein [Clostridiales bacterium]
MSLRRWMAAGRRTLSGALAVVLTAILILGNVQFTFAGEASERFFKEESDLTDDEGYSTATLSNASLANEENKGLTVSVFSEDSDFRPGGDVTLEVHVKNDTGETITDGQISYRASGIDKDSAYFEILDESVVSSYEDFETYEDAGIDDSADIELELDIDPVAAAKHAISDVVHAVKEKLFGGDADSNEDEEDEKPIKIKNIDLAPGEIYSARFHFEISDSIEKAKNQNVKFFFRGMGEEEDRRFGQGEFLYTVSYLNLDPVEFEEGNAVYTGEEVTMGLHTTMYDFDAILTDSFTDTVASPSDATASPSDATKATASPSDATATASDANADETITIYEDEITNGYIVDLEETSYRIEMTDARLKGLDVHKALVNDVNDNMLLCSFHVAKDTEPGIYFGKIIQESKTKNTTYRSSQGFSLIVEGEGEITLQGSLGDTTVTVSGPAGAFPEADELELEISEASETQISMVESALEEKSRQESREYLSYQALNLELYADGIQAQLCGAVQVTFHDIHRETDESIQVLHINEETREAEEMTSFENECDEVVMETTHFSLFVLRTRCHRRMFSPEPLP